MDSEYLDGLRKALPMSFCLDQLGIQRFGKRKLRCPGHVSKSNENGQNTFITPDNESIYCFTEEKSFDVIDVIRLVHPDLEFLEAVEMAAKMAPNGYPLPTKTSELPKDPRLAYFQEARQCFLKDPTALNFMVNLRGFSKKEVLNMRDIGYCPLDTSLCDRLLKKGFSKEELTKAGLINCGGYDFFHGRVIFWTGDMLYGRDITGEAEVKWLRLSGNQSMVYRQKQAQKASVVISTEGIMDQKTAEKYLRDLKLFEYQSICSFGTSIMKMNHVQDIVSAGATKMWIIFVDSDPLWREVRDENDRIISKTRHAKGQISALQQARWVESLGIPVLLAELPTKDLNDFLIAGHDSADFLLYLENAIPPLEFVLNLEAKYHDINTYKGKRMFLTRAKSLITQFQAGPNSNAIDLVSQLVNLSPDEVEPELNDTLKISKIKNMLQEMIAKGQVQPDTTIGDIIGIKKD